MCKSFAALHFGTSVSSIVRRNDEKREGEEMGTLRNLNYFIVRIAVIVFFIVCLISCATSVNQIRKWEKSGNIPKLSEVARDKSESPYIRKKSLESLARLNWEPSNDERLQVYSLFASMNDYQEASRLLETITAENFT
jgi:hypothetical protein